MRSAVKVPVIAAATVVLSSLSGCADNPPPAPVVAPAPAPAPGPVVVGYQAALKPVAAKKQVLHAANPALCADVKGDNAAQHALVRLSPCHGRENQRWDFGAGVAGAVQVGGIGGLCLSVMAAPSGGDATMTEILTCNGSAAQEFRFYADGRIQELASNRCLQSGGGASGNGIVLGPCDAANPAQVWALDTH